MNQLIRQVCCTLISMLHLVLASQLCGQESSVRQYFLDVSQGGHHDRWASPGEARNHIRSFCVHKEYKECSVYLFVGDIFEFVGERRRAPLRGVLAPYNVDALLLSTNVDAKWHVENVLIKNPTIQKNLHQFLNTPQHKRAYKTIDSLFAEPRKMEVCRDAISTSIIPDFSPQQFCFIATDRKEDGTYLDLDFLEKKLNEKDLARGVCAALTSVNRTGARSIVMPFLASSRPDLRGQLPRCHKAYLDPTSYEVKAEIIKRNRMSLSGMLWGIHHFIDSMNPEALKTREIGIVLYHDDLKYFNNVEDAVKEYFGFEGLRHALVGKEPTAEVFGDLLTSPRDTILSGNCE